MCGSIRQLIRNCDSFGRPIQFKYKQKDVYQTILGGICSIVAFLLIGIFMVNILYELLRSP